MDDAAVLVGLVYVDLNPIRARLASTPEESEFTGSHERIMARQAQRKLAALAADEDASPAQGQWIGKQGSQRDCDAWLSAIERVTGLDANARMGLLPLSLDAYLSLYSLVLSDIQRGSRHLCLVLLSGFVLCK